jgi:hypothetical protein
MSILKFKTIEEAITRSNASMYGLAAGICTRDVGRALRCARELRAGTVWVNCYNVFDAAQVCGSAGCGGDDDDDGDDGASFTACGADSCCRHLAASSNPASAASSASACPPRASPCHKV